MLKLIVNNSHLKKKKTRGHIDAVQKMINFKPKQPEIQTHIGWTVLYSNMFNLWGI